MRMSASIRSTARKREACFAIDGCLRPLPGEHSVRLRVSHRLIIRDGLGHTVRAESFHNLVATACKNYLPRCGLANAAAPITSWYAGMIGETRHTSHGATISGQATLTSLSASLIAADTSRQITVFGAGTASANLLTAILSIRNGTTGRVGRKREHHRYRDADISRIANRQRAGCRTNECKTQEWSLFIYLHHSRGRPFGHLERLARCGKRHWQSERHRSPNLHDRS